CRARRRSALAFIVCSSRPSRQLDIHVTRCEGASSWKVGFVDFIHRLHRHRGSFPTPVAVQLCCSPAPSNSKNLTFSGDRKHQNRSQEAELFNGSSTDL